MGWGVGGVATPPPPATLEATGQCRSDTALSGGEWQALQLCHIFGIFWIVTDSFGVFGVGLLYFYLLSLLLLIATNRAELMRERDR